MAHAKPNAQKSIFDVASHPASLIQNFTPEMQARTIVKQFENAKTPVDFIEAERVWLAAKSGFEKYEKNLQCEQYGSLHDQEIGKDLIDGLAERPIILTYHIAQLILGILGMDRDEAAEALKQSLEDTKKFLKDKAQEKAIEKLKDLSAHNNGLSSRLKENLLKALAVLSKRYRSRFIQIIEDIGVIAKSYGGIALKVVQASAPSRISPENCGLVAWILDARQSALNRLFSTPVTGVAVKRSL